MREAVQETVEEVGRAYEFMGYVKAVLVAFGSIGCGVLIAFYAPDDLREEIPIHREVGIGFMVFGGLFVLALFCDSGPGSIGQRAKSLLVGALTGTIAVGCGLSGMGPYGLGGYAVALIMGVFSLLALWEVISGRVEVTGDP